MFLSYLELIKLIFREMISLKGLDRCPEPSTVMTDSQSIESFHTQGSEAGALIPIYHFNALAISALLPRDGVLVDLGSGSGQFLSYFARCRPDSKIIGFDLSEKMIEAGEKALRNSNAGIGGNIRLCIGDMTNFSALIPEQINVISSIFAFHHLPCSEDLIRCLGEIKAVRGRCGCGVWIFDHARPRSKETAEIFPELFTPQAPERFRRDSTNSLLASFSFSELSELIDAASVERFSHERSRLLRLYQIHWLEGQDEQKLDQKAVCREVSLRPAEYRAFRQLRMLFKRVPF